MTTERYPFELDVCAKCENTFRRPSPETITLLAIKPELRVVYRLPNGKTFLTRAGAYSRYAWLKIREKYPCDRQCVNDLPWGGQTDPCGCDHYDGDSAALHKRFVRWLTWADRTTRKNGAPSPTSLRPDAK